jgi:hypothetical protein
MADNRSRIESVRRELRAIASFDAQKIHESSGAAAFYNQPSSRPGAPLLFAALFAFCLQAGANSQPLTRSSARGAALHLAQQEQRAGLQEQVLLCCCARPSPAQSGSRHNPLYAEFFWMRSRRFSAERTRS